MLVIGGRTGLGEFDLRGGLGDGFFGVEFSLSFSLVFEEELKLCSKGFGSSPKSERFLGGPGTVGGVTLLDRKSVV